MRSDPQTQHASSFDGVNGHRISVSRITLMRERANEAGVRPSPVQQPAAQTEEEGGQDDVRGQAMDILAGLASLGISDALREKVSRPAMRVHPPCVRGACDLIFDSSLQVQTALDQLEQATASAATAVAQPTSTSPKSSSSKSSPAEKALAKQVRMSRSRILRSLFQLVELLHRSRLWRRSWPCPEASCESCTTRQSTSRKISGLLR